MEQKKISQETIAAALGIRQEAVSRRVRGKMEWRASELPPLAAVLGVPVGELLDEQPAARAS
jgi:transcriptional regulator with XRE-family HTH domain